MTDKSEEIVDAIRSSDPDRVNEAIDRIKDMDADERARVLDTGFDAFAEAYADSDDGYVRQSVVRVFKAFLPGLAAAFLLGDDDRTDSDAVEGLEDRLDASAGFLLEAIQDEDGRVRLAAQRALKDVFRSYDALDDSQTIAALATELDELADDYEGKRRDHLLDAKDDAEFFLQPDGARLMKGIERLVERSKDR